MGRACRSVGKFSTRQLDAKIGSLHSCSPVERISESYSVGYSELCLGVVVYLLHALAEESKNIFNTLKSEPWSP